MSFSDILIEVIFFGAFFGVIWIMASISRQDQRDTRVMSEACRIVRNARRRAKSQVK